MDNQLAFPVSCPDEVFKNNPKFGYLLTKLMEKLTPDGRSQHIQKHFELAQQRISQSRHTWLMSAVIYNELSEFLADSEIKYQEGTLSVDERQLKDVLSKAFAFSDVGGQLNILSSGSTVLFGLSPEVIDKYNPVKHNTTDLQQILLPVLENRLRNKSQELYNFFDPNNESLSDHLLVAKSQSLPVLVEQRRQDLVQEIESLKQDRSLRDKQFWMQYQKILESLSIMETIIRQFKLTKQAELDDVTVQLLQAQSEAICLKMRVLQLQILCEAYTLETVKALNKIRGHLDLSIMDTERELASTLQSVQAYLDLGTQFKSLVEQNKQLQQEIENRKWALQQLVKK
ncbi:unnamed protein product [Candidula unifasciata]|uniref:HAUS augmin-like complex subunit 4 n=1 Tax=Candidula unifasciata TaxID=100452 RepID=A0A8S3Z8S8_9EUPU|nr:unnamed protein product [Candidula unifasciata]